MKLIGSKMEEDSRKIMIKSHRSLFHEGGNQRLVNALRTYFPNLKTAYIIGHTPEQDEDIYLILVNASIIASVELNRYDLSVEAIFKTIPLEHYRKGLSRARQIELAVAVDLSNNDLRFNSDH